MGRRRGLHPGAGRAGDARYVHLVLEHPGRRQRQQRQLDGRGEAARIGHAARRANPLAAELRQSVDEPFALVAEVLRQVDDAQRLGELLRGEPLAALAVGRAEEDHVDLLQVVLRAEAQPGLAVEPRVDLRECIARMARAVDEAQLDPGMVHQQAEQLAGRIAGAADDSDPYHRPLRLWTL